jgi:hypothetical protein
MASLQLDFWIVSKDQQNNFRVRRQSGRKRTAILPGAESQPNARDKSWTIAFAHRLSGITEFTNIRDAMVALLSPEALPDVLENES